MFKAEAIKPSEHCSECGFYKLYGHSSRKQLIMDLTICSEQVGLQLNRKRYKCREFRSTFWERLIAVNEKHNLSNESNCCSMISFIRSVNHDLIRSLLTKLCYTILSIGLK
ncbi:MAG: transposase family protein [Sporolactobacillus sp.]